MKRWGALNLILMDKFGRDFLPNELARKDTQLKAYFEKYGRNLLIDYVDAECKDKSYRS